VADSERFAAYLRGFETSKRTQLDDPTGWFAAYLRGFETPSSASETWRCRRLQPTYEDLKLGSNLEHGRNTRTFAAYLRGFETVKALAIPPPQQRLQPTYEDLKQCS